jgi:tetratricopeptide (TPR) repeat protein
MREWITAEKIPPGSSFYASHPKLEERIKDLGALAAARAPGGERGVERYQARTAGILLDGARGELASGRLGAARRLGGRYVAARPTDPRGHQVLGEIERREGTPEADDAALASYRRALELDARFPEAWRGLGLLLQRRGDRAGAREALSRYLELAPDAPDRAHVTAMLREPSGGPP